MRLLFVDKSICVTLTGIRCNMYIKFLLQVYVCQLELDMHICIKRNVHGRTEKEIEELISGWEDTPSHHPMIDATSLIQSGSIPDVEMEEINSPSSMDIANDDTNEVRSKVLVSFTFRSSKCGLLS